MAASAKRVLAIAAALTIQFAWTPSAQALDCPLFRRGDDASLQRVFSDAKKTGGHVVVVRRIYCRVIATNLRSNNLDSLCIAEVIEDWTNNRKTYAPDDVYDSFEDQLFYVRRRWIDGTINIDELFNAPRHARSATVPLSGYVIHPVAALPVGQRRGPWITIAGIKLPIHGFQWACSRYFPVLERFRMLAASAGLQSRSQGGGD